MRIGLIADTHGLLRESALNYLRGSDLIIHAGDVGKPEILDELATLAPVHTVRGNNDTGEWAAVLPEEQVVEADGLRVYVIHDLGEMTLDPSASGYAAVVSGHSHKPVIRTSDDVLYVNPGSAGRRRFKLPICVGELIVAGGRVTAETQELPP